MNRCTMMVLDKADKLLSQDFKNMLDDDIGFVVVLLFHLRRVPNEPMHDDGSG